MSTQGGGLAFSITMQWQRECTIWCIDTIHGVVCSQICESTLLMVFGRPQALGIQLKTSYTLRCVLMPG